LYASLVVKANTIATAAVQLQLDRSMFVYTRVYSIHRFISCAWLRVFWRVYVELSGNRPKASRPRQTTFSSSLSAAVPEWLASCPLRLCATQLVMETKLEILGSFRFGLDFR